MKRQSRRMKRERMKEEVKHQRSAKIIAEKRRVEWLREKYLDFVRSVREGNPWSFEKYQKHATEIETPITYTIGNYKVVTGGIDKSACFKTLAGEIISDAISGRSKNFSEQMNDRDTSLTAATKKKKISDSRTENTYFGSDALSAERRLTKRTKQDQAEEKERKMKTLTKNIHAGKEVVQHIVNLKTAEETLTCADVPIENEYWQVNMQSVKDKLKVYLRLWYFPDGGGKLSKTKPEQMDALTKFNLTKDGVMNRVEECKKQVGLWEAELHELSETG